MKGGSMSRSATFAQQVRNAFQDSIETKLAFNQGDGPETVATMAQVIAKAFTAGHKLMLCGNGGSAADAQHLAAECLVRLRSTHNRDALPALTLATDTSMLTACGNDFGFDDIFVRPLSALGRPGDVLLGITTSGKSPNIVNALKLAHEMGITTLGFLGCDGGAALSHCDHALVAPSNDTARIQETHITAGHALIALIEDILAEDIQVP